MRIKCSQCGFEHIVMESDFFLRCQYCDSRILVETPRGTPVMIRATTTDESVRRLFPPGMVVSLERKYFPYLETGEGGSRTMVPCFNQPWQELDAYRPPDGDRVVFDDSMAEPGEMIPLDRDLLEDSRGRLVLHPFFVVMLKLQGYSEGMLVDGVSGRLLGEVPLTAEEPGGDRSIEKLFLKVLAGGLAISVPVYFLGKSLDFSTIPRFWFNIAVVAFLGAMIYFRGKGRS